MLYEAILNPEAVEKLNNLQFDAYTSYRTATEIKPNGQRRQMIQQSTENFFVVTWLNKASVNEGELVIRKNGTIFAPSGIRDEDLLIKLNALRSFIGDFSLTVIRAHDGNVELLRANGFVA